MKNKIMKKKSIYEISKYSLVLVLTMLVILSCSDDNSEISQTETAADLDDIEAIAEAEDVGVLIDDISDIISFDFEASEAYKSEQAKSDFFRSYFSDCVVVTLVVEDKNVNVKLDFGDGCTGPHDQVLKGVILASIQQISASEMSINHTFENFFVNEKEITGSVSKIRTKQNEDGFPEAIVTRDLTVTWKDELSVTNKGKITRTWIEGFGNRNWGDNVFLVTGSWTVSKNEETVRTVEVIEALRREMACRFLVSGKLQIESVRGDYVLDFGDGECDNMALVSKDDIDYEIELGRVRKWKK